jgi:hypothetical protein
MKRSAMIASLCGLALVGAGCGDDDDDNQGLSYEDTGAEISKICDTVPDGEELGLTGDAKQDAPKLDEAVAAFEKAIADVEALEVDEELEDERDRFVEIGKGQLEYARELQSAAAQGDDAEYRRVAEDIATTAASTNTESKEVGSRLGAEGCVE